MSFAKDVNRRLPRDLRADSVLGHILSAPVAAAISALSEHQRQWTNAVMSEMFNATLKKYQTDKGKVDSIRLIQNVVGRLLNIKAKDLTKDDEEIINKDDRFWVNDPEAGQTDLKVFYDTWSEFVKLAPDKLRDLTSELKECKEKWAMKPDKKKDDDRPDAAAVLARLNTTLTGVRQLQIRQANGDLKVVPAGTVPPVLKAELDAIKVALETLVAETRPKRVMINDEVLDELLKDVPKDTNRDLGNLNVDGDPNVTDMTGTGEGKDTTEPVNSEYHTKVLAEEQKQTKEKAERSQKEVKSSLASQNMYNAAGDIAKPQTLVDQVDGEDSPFSSIFKGNEPSAKPNSETPLTPASKKKEPFADPNFDNPPLQDDTQNWK